MGLKENKTSYYTVEVTYPVGLKEFDAEILMGHAPDGHWVTPMFVGADPELPPQDTQTMQWDFVNSKDAKDAFNLLDTHPRNKELMFVSILRHRP